MKYKLLLFTTLLCFSSCSKEQNSKEQSETILDGTWKMVYAETKENDSIQVKDLSNTSFIKILNKSHFAFFNQNETNSKAFYGGAGTYTLKGNNYNETLSYTSVDAIRHHSFPFTIEIKGDTLIQSGMEEVKSTGIKREIIEKYIRVK